MERVYHVEAKRTEYFPFRWVVNLRRFHSKLTLPASNGSKDYRVNLTLGIRVNVWLHHQELFFAALSCQSKQPNNARLPIGPEAFFGSSAAQVFTKMLEICKRACSPGTPDARCTARDYVFLCTTFRAASIGIPSSEIPWGENHLPRHGQYNYEGLFRDNSTVLNVLDRALTRRQLGRTTIDGLRNLLAILELLLMYNLAAEPIRNTRVSEFGYYNIEGVTEYKLLVPTRRHLIDILTYYFTELAYRTDLLATPRSQTSDSRLDTSHGSLLDGSFKRWLRRP